MLSLHKNGNEWSFILGRVSLPKLWHGARGQAVLGWVKTLLHEHVMMISVHWFFYSLICYCPGGCFLLLKQKLFMHSAMARAVRTLKCGYDSFLLMEANPQHKRSKLFHLSPPWHGGLYNRLGGFLVWFCSLYERNIYFASHAAALQEKLCWLHTFFWTGKCVCLMTLKPISRQIFPLSHPSRYYLFALSP